MLCGRPIIQSLGIIMDFANKRIRFNDGPCKNGSRFGAHVSAFGLGPREGCASRFLPRIKFERARSYDWQPWRAPFFDGAR